jgi:hypothetical protein
MPTIINVPTCIVDVTEFTLLCFWILDRISIFPCNIKIFFGKFIYEFCSLACSVISVSTSSILLALGCL